MSNRSAYVYVRKEELANPLEKAGRQQCQFKVYVTRDYEQYTSRSAEDMVAE
jgi:hypothetical protein